MPDKQFLGCTMIGSDFQKFLDKADFVYFNFKWEMDSTTPPHWKLAIQGYALYEPIKEPVIKADSHAPKIIKEKIITELNLFRKQIQTILPKGFEIERVNFNPFQSEIGEIVALNILFEGKPGLATISAILNPSPPAPPSDSFG